MNTVINCKNKEFVIKTVKKYSEEQENDLIYCFDLLCKQKDKYFNIICNELPNDEINIYYDIANQILYYNGVEFYSYEIIELKRHLIYMCVFNCFSICSYEHNHYIVNGNYDIQGIYKKLLLTKCVCHYHHPIIYFENSMYIPNSVEELEDFIVCYNFLLENNLAHYYSVQHMTYKDIDVGFNLRPYIQPLIDELQSKKLPITE